MSGVTVTYDLTQFMFFLDIILIIIFIALGESTKKNQYFKRGMSFFIGGIMLLFTGLDVFFTQSGYWWLSLSITFAGGMYFFRGCINLAQAKRSNREEAVD